MGYGEGKELIGPDGVAYVLKKAEIAPKVESVESSVDDLFADDFEEEEEDDNFWSFDSSSVEIVYGEEAQEYEEKVEYNDGINFETCHVRAIMWLM